MNLKSKERAAKRYKICFFAAFEFLVINDLEYVRNNYPEFLRRVMKIANQDADKFLGCDILMKEVAETLNAIALNKMPPLFKEYESKPKERKGSCYFISCESDEIKIAGKRIKIGVSDDIDIRLSQLQAYCPYDLKLYGFIECEFSQMIEIFFHHKFSDYRIRGEWFNVLEVTEEFEKTYSTLKKKFCDY
jgi:hypothetical protein